MEKECKFKLCLKKFQKDITKTKQTNKNRNSKIKLIQVKLSHKSQIEKVYPMLKSKINFDGGGKDNDNNKITLRCTGIHPNIYCTNYNKIILKDIKIVLHKQKIYLKVLFPLKLFYNLTQFQ